MFKKKSNFDYHQENLYLLEEKGKIISEFEEGKNWKKYGENKNDNQGWWMVIKVVAVSKYWGAHLKIHKSKKSPDKKVFLVDLLSGPGLCEVTKNNKKEKLIFPGITLLAASRNQNTRYYFDKIYANDLDFENRIILNKRLRNLNQSKIISGKIDYYIPLVDQKHESDSNLIIEDILEDIKKEGKGFFACLFVIDNQALNIKWETIEKIIKFHTYFDLIINFPNTIFNRIWGNRKYEGARKKIESFMGMSINEINSNDEAMELYIKKLKEAGKEIVEKFEVRAGGTAGGFHYTLLFAVRKTASDSSWMRIINNLRRRYSNMTGEDIKLFFDIISNKQKSLITFY